MLCIFYDFLVFCWLFAKLTFSKKSSWTLSECQTVCGKLSVLICAQSICKGYQQNTKVVASLERICSWKFLIKCYNQLPRHDRFMCYCLEQIKVNLVINGVARTLKSLRTSKGDYWNKQWFSLIAPPFKIGTSLKGKNLLPEGAYSLR